MPNDIVDNQLCYMTQPGVKISTITADPLKPADWIDLKDEKNLVFETKAEASEKNISYTLKPFFAIHHKRYALYFNSGTGKEDSRNLKYEDITTDLIEPGRQQSEVEHHGKYFNTKMNYIPEIDRNCRQILSSQGNISYRIKFDSKSGKLVLSFYGKDKGSLTVNTDGKELSTIQINSDKGEGIFDAEIPLPKDLLNSKSKGKPNAYINISFTCKENESLQLCEIRAIK